MATKEQKIDIARALYVSGRNEDDIASILESSKRTIQNYKSEDSSKGNDWDVLRAQKHIDSDTPRRGYLYSDFVGYMHETLKEVRESTITSSEKADMIVRLSDAFSKMKGIIRHEDPIAFKHGIIKHVIQEIGEGIKARGDSAMLERFIEIIDDIGERLDVAI